MIQEKFKDAIDRFVKDGILPGGFLTACLENNLMIAVGAADQNTFLQLKDIVKYLYNDIPAHCWGTKQRVHDWQLEKSRQKIENH